MDNVFLAFDKIIEQGKRAAKDARKPVVLGEQEKNIFKIKGRSFPFVKLHTVDYHSSILRAESEEDRLSKKFMVW